jgi:tetratricopeptide (TPR) repeat protein
MREGDGAPEATPGQVVTTGNSGLSYFEVKRNKSRKRARWHDIADELDAELWPEVRPSFRLQAGDTVFTVGSCFARHIEAHLAALGCKVPMLDFRLPPEEFDGPANSAMNKFHPPSIRQCLEWTARIFDRDGVVTWKDCEPWAFDSGDEVFIDLDMAARAVPKARFIQRRQEIYDVFYKVFAADGLMMTPGLIEAWRDVETGLYTFGAPWGRQVQTTPHRWRFEVLPYQRCVEELLTAIDVVRARNPKVKILVTTSPVPLTRTFTGRDIAIANTHSKAVLRAACDAVLGEREGVDYFPSYEMATLSNPALVWRSDRVHVSQGFVGKIVGHMLDHYIEGVEAAAAHYQRARTLIAAGSYGEAEAEAREALAARPDHLEARLVLARVLEGRKLWSEAEAELRVALAADPQRADVRAKLSRVLAGANRVEEAVAMLDEAMATPSFTFADFLGADRTLASAPADEAVRLGQRAIEMFPLHVLVHERLTAALLRAERKPEAMEALQRAAKLSHPTPEILLPLARLLLEAGDREGALARVQHAISEDPRNKEAVWLRNELLAGSVPA